MKCFYSLVFALFLPIVASANEVVINGLNYNLNSKTESAEVINGAYTNLGDVTIPEYVEYEEKKYKVTSIGKEAFKNCTSMTSIIIGNGVEKIGDDAFEFCKNLISISIGDNVATIGKHAFGYCEKLSTISLPNSVQSVGTNLFNSCKKLSSAIIGNGLKAMGYGMFEYCSNLQSVTIGENVTSIGQEAFHNCSKMTSITIPKSVSYINKSAFWDCTGLRSVVISDIAAWCKIEFGDIASNPLYYAHHLYNEDKTEITEITIPDNTTNIGNYSFVGLSALATVIIPASVTSIGKSAFSGCSKLSSLSIPNSVTTIGKSAFSGCCSLPSISVPYSVNYIGDSAFEECTALKSLSVNANDIDFGNRVFRKCQELTDVFCYSNKLLSVPENVFQDSYVEYAILHVRQSLIKSYKEVKPWSDFKEIVTLDIPHHTLSYIVDGEIYKSYELEEGEQITPEDAPTKEGYTFSGWSDIPETMPANDVTVTGTFSVNKYKLTYVVDGAEYKSYDVDYGAAITPEPEPIKDGYTFSGWSDIPETMPANDVTITGTFSAIIATKYTLTYKVDGEVYKTYELEEGTAITPEPAPTKEGCTFSGWSEIPETMPANDVTVTGTFSVNKYKLTYMVDGAEYKSYDVDYGTAITPEPEPTKDGYTFLGWSEIPATMPAKDVTITGTFSINKYKLTYMVDDAEYKSYDIEYGATITPEPAPTKDGYTFSGWSDIPETMPANDVVVTGSFSVIVIKEDTGEFTATSGSTAELSNDNNVIGEYEIPETVTHDGVTYTVTSIGNEAFKDNTNLTDVTIPSTITSIGESAFAGCSNLKSITVNSTTPIVFPSASRTRGGSSVFEGVDKTTCILYVPEGSVEAYKAAPVWGEFTNILVIGSTGINSIINNGEPQDIYDLQGHKVKVKATSLEGLSPGVYIINGKKTILK